MEIDSDLVLEDYTKHIVRDEFYSTKIDKFHCLTHDEQLYKFQVLLQHPKTQDSIERNRIIFVLLEFSTHEVEQYA